MNSIILHVNSNHKVFIMKKTLKNPVQYLTQFMLVNLCYHLQQCLPNRYKDKVAMMLWLVSGCSQKPHVVLVGGQAFQRWLILEFVNGSLSNIRIGGMSVSLALDWLSCIQYKRGKVVCSSLLPLLSCHF